MENVTIKLPEEVKEKLERLAIDDRRSMSNFVRNIVLDWLEGHEKKKPKK
jgi:Arc/MetJ-type ribon-helix-helix transcriptional regulator